MKRILLWAAFLAGAAWLQAEGEHFATLKAGAESYTNVTVTSVTATQVYFTHSRGLGNARLKDIEPNLQKLFHYNAATAAAAETQRLQANAAYRQALLTAPKPKAPAQPAPDLGEPLPPYTINALSRLNRSAPTLQVEKWLTPEPNTQGKFVLVDFWATWCGPCRHSIPHLNTLYSSYNDRLVVIGLSNEPEGAVRRMTSPAIGYSVAIDTQRRMSMALRVRSIPHAILIDPNGVVRFEGNPEYLTSDNLARLLDKYGQ